MSSTRNTILALVVVGLAAAAGLTQDGASGEGDNAMSDFAKPSPDELKQRLTPRQFEVTQQCGTEPAFNNEYWDNHEPGIYVDVVSGEPLFSSLDKYDSGSGWPAFSRPLTEANIQLREDRGLFMRRTEVRSSHADSHLGAILPIEKFMLLLFVASSFRPDEFREKEQAIDIGGGLSAG